MPASDLKKAYFIALAAAAILLLFSRGTSTMEDRHPAFSAGNYLIGEADMDDIGSAFEKAENSPGKGWHIHINLDQLTLYLYRDGEFIKSYPVSGGAPRTPSPAGDWKVISKETWGEGFGGSWLGFNVPWGQYGIHGTSEPWFIGRSNSSKGCIRMKNADAAELFGLVPYGTSVTILQEDREFRILKNGDVGSDVAEVQRALKKLGYYPWHIDGQFGSILENSINDFQKDNGLWGGGTVYKNTYELMLRKASEYNGGN